MNEKIVDVVCIKSGGALFNFPLTIDKVYEHARFVWTEDPKFDGMVTIINDNGVEDSYSSNFFRIVREY